MQYDFKNKSETYLLLVFTFANKRKAITVLISFLKIFALIYLFTFHVVFFFLADSGQRPKLPKIDEPLSGLRRIRQKRQKYEMRIAKILLNLKFFHNYG